MNKTNFFIQVFGESIIISAIAALVGIGIGYLVLATGEIYPYQSSYLAVLIIAVIAINLIKDHRALYVFPVIIAMTTINYEHNYLIIFSLFASIVIHTMLRIRIALSISTQAFTIEKEYKNCDVVADLKIARDKLRALKKLSPFGHEMINFKIEALAKRRNKLA